MGTMNDALRTKMNLILTAAVAFAVGLGIAARLDLTPPGLAQLSDNPPLNINVVSPEPIQSGVVLQAGFSDIADQVTPAVVTIYVERSIPEHQARRQLPSPFEDFFRQPQNEPPGIVRGSGSGFIISADGYIVTNNHVIDSAERVQVELSDRRQFDATIVGRDPTTDVALLRIETSGLSPVTFGSSDATRVGEWVLAIGSPGFSGSRTGPLLTTVTAGIVSAKGRNINIINAEQDDGGGNLAIEDFIQTDAAINPGNSGGPLVNIRGEVIGMNTAIASNTGGYQGYGFAVPIDLAREVVEDLVEYGEVRRALLGVSILGVDDTEARYYGLEQVAGAKVMAVSEGQAADRAGIEAGDVIIAVNDESVESVPDLQRKIRRHEPGETVEVTLVRGEDLSRETVRVELMDAGDLEPAATRVASDSGSDDPLGLEVENITPEIRRALDLPSDVSGVVVSSVEQYGPFWRRAGNNGRGTVITRVNRQPVESVREYRDALDTAEPGDVIGLDLYSPTASQKVPITIQIPR